MIEDEIAQHREIGLIFVAVFVFIAVLIAMTTVHRLLSSQRMQIGILKALGFRKRQLYLHYISHSTIVCLLGAAAGWCAGYVVLPKIFYPIMREIYTLPEDVYKRQARASPVRELPRKTTGSVRIWMQRWKL